MKQGHKIMYTMPRAYPYKKVYQLKIELKTSPKVWRRILVPNTYTFYDLHVAIQDAMGWKDYHLFEFRYEAKQHEFIRYISLFEDIEAPFPGAKDVYKEKYATEHSIKEYFDIHDQPLLYIYDYGDDWHHEIHLEKVMEKEKNTKYPKCIAGKYACPPEDCGGSSGYENCIRAFDSKDNSDDLLSWFGSWNPYVFDSFEVKFVRPSTRLKFSLPD